MRDEPPIQALPGSTSSHSFSHGPIGKDILLAVMTKTPNFNKFGPGHFHIYELFKSNAQLS